MTDLCLSFEYFVQLAAILNSIKKKYFCKIKIIFAIKQWQVYIYEKKKF